MQEYIKKILGSGHHPSDSASHDNTTLTKSSDETKGIIKIVTSLKDSDLLLKEVSETIQIESKEQKAGFLRMFLGTLDASLLGNILAGKGINRTGERAIAKRQDRGIVRAGYGNKKVQKTTTKKKKNF